MVFDQFPSMAALFGVGLMKKKQCRFTAVFSEKREKNRCKFIIQVVYLFVVAWLLAFVWGFLPENFAFPVNTRR